MLEFNINTFEDLKSGQNGLATQALTLMLAKIPANLA
jgi:hypothetical protein